MSCRLFLVVIFLTFLFSCKDAYRKEKIINISYTIDNDPLYYDTEFAIIKFDKNDVIKNVKQYLKKHEHYDRQVFLEYLINSNDIITMKSDTVYNQIWDKFLQVIML